ncbi:MAG: hypothetical protein ACXADL_11275 [Candidatus Thorarchaeota archaeon]
MLKFKKVDFAGATTAYIVHWPHACVSCGSSNIENVSPNFVEIMDSFKANINNAETNLRIYIKSKLFLCRDCRKEILTATKIPSKGLRGHGGLVQKLESDPYRQFICLTKKGEFWCAEGQFKDKLAEINPTLQIHTGKNPLVELKEKIPKDAEIPAVSIEEIDAWPPLEGEDAEPQEDTDQIIQLRNSLREDQSNAENWHILVRELVKLGRCEAAVKALQTAIKYVDRKSIASMMKIVSENCEKFK